MKIDLILGVASVTREMAGAYETLTKFLLSQVNKGSGFSSMYREHRGTEQRERDAAKSPIVPALMLVREFPGSNPGPFEASGELIQRRRDPLEEDVMLR